MRRSNTGYHEGKFIFPGGRIEGGETLRQAASREVLEEVGVFGLAFALICFGYVGSIHRRPTQELEDSPSAPSGQRT